MANIDDFKKLDIRVGKIISVEDFLEAKKPMYKLKIDFGEFTKFSGAAIRPFYRKEELLNTKVIAIVNLEPRKIATFVSECLTLGAEINGKFVLLRPDKDIEIGAKIF
jgi:tRNA-binding protein